MKNPWLKKNPALSVALSVANAWAGSVRGLARLRGFAPRMPDFALDWDR
jgi:hypothetical protein